MLDEVLTVAAIDPDLADVGVFGGDLVQEPGAGDGVLHLHAAIGVTPLAYRRTFRSEAATLQATSWSGSRPPSAIE
ncbi:hypothetical protein ABZZ01_17260 [Streptomyces virginiae]|uniref:hypothetical protein n=1 Tax=Streptomyces virginiae TaxID=1961 RepID=UPI0033B10FFD